MKNIEKEAELFGMEDEDGFPVMNTDKKDGFKVGAEWMRDKAIKAFCEANCPKECSFGKGGGIGCGAKHRFIEKLNEK